MNTDNPYKVGDLVSLRVVKYEQPNYFSQPSKSSCYDANYKVKVIARRVVRVYGDAVVIRLDKKLKAVEYRSVNRVY